MTTQKTCEKIVFYCDAETNKTFRGLPLYESWPKLPHHDSENAIRWAEGWHRKSLPCIVIEMDNCFKDATIYDDVDSRGQSAKVPSAVVYNKDHECYLKFDFRTDGLIELLTHGTVAHGKIKADMAFRYAGSNYFFVRKDSDSFKEFAKSFDPKAKKKTTSKVDVGVPFYGSFDDIYVYLGKFKCTEDKDNCTYTPSYENQYVHVYQKLACYDYRQNLMRYDDQVVITANKNKMNVKGIIDSKDKDYNDIINIISQDKYIESEHINKGNYPADVGWRERAYCVLDRNSDEFKISNKPIPNTYGGTCGGHPLGSFGIGGLFK